MAMCRLNNAEFHKFLNEFSEEVSKGRYKKMPYDKYRTFRNLHDTSVDIVLDKYTNFNGDRVQRIRISPDGPTGYEFYIDDGSFGNFCYDYLKNKEEPRVHPDEKKTYDIFRNVSYDCYDKASDTVKSVLHEYWADKALNSSSSADCAISCDKIDTGTSTKGVVYNYNPGIKVMQDDIDAIGEKSSLAKTMSERALAEIEELREDISRKTDISSVEADICELDYRLTKDISENAYTIQCHDKMLTELKKTIDGIAGTSSACYPVKNYSLNINADYMSADDGKENENMDTNKMFNFDFGPVASHIRMSPYGLAMKNADGKYVSYDKASGNIMDVEIFNFDAQKFLYKMPVAVSAVAVGDIVVHMRKAMFVSAVNGNRISVVDIYNGEVKDIMPTTSPFGFNFITKVVSLVDVTGANADNPFGNLLPLLMMGEGKDFKDVLPLMLMTGNTGAFGNMNQNSLLWFAMMSDKGNMSDMLPFLLMGNMFQAPATEHHGCCHSNHEHNGECHN
jgi:hypothetical protein